MTEELSAANYGHKHPLEIIEEVLVVMDRGGRVPGSSPSPNMTRQEAILLEELNWVEELRQTDKLRAFVPMQRVRDMITLRLADIAQAGYIYRQMTHYIPETAPDGVTLNIPAQARAGWSADLSRWKTVHGEDRTPRAVITGRFGLPLNFHDLTPEEQQEVLLGNYLKIQ